MLLLLPCFSLFYLFDLEKVFKIGNSYKCLCSCTPYTECIPLYCIYLIGFTEFSQQYNSCSKLSYKSVIITLKKFFDALEKNSETKNIFLNAFL